MTATKAQSGPKKLHLDFRANSSLCANMENPEPESRTDLVAALMLEAGRLMEDASPEFALTLPSDQTGIEARIEQLATIAKHLQSFAKASHALLQISAADEPRRS